MRAIMGNKFVAASDLDCHVRGSGSHSRDQPRVQVQRGTLRNIQRDSFQQLERAFWCDITMAD